MTGTDTSLSDKLLQTQVIPTTSKNTVSSAHLLHTTTQTHLQPLIELLVHLLLYRPIQLRLERRHLRIGRQKRIALLTRFFRKHSHGISPIVQLA
jgi:hypothetical protein